MSGPTHELREQDWQLQLRARVAAANITEVFQACPMCMLPMSVGQDRDNQQDGIITKQLEGHIMMCQACIDNALFKQPLPNEECPICFLTISSLPTGKRYKSCCGKVICSGCIHAVQMMDSDAKCPFCRVPKPESDEEVIERFKKRAEMDDATAIHSHGCQYDKGNYGFPQDHAKALELWRRAAELGSALANVGIGCAYYYGRGVERDIEKAKLYWELAAIGGDAKARYNLGLFEKRAGNMNRALKHFISAAECGNPNDSLKEVREFYVNGRATKNDYAKALQLYQEYIDGIKSVQRDKAAAFSENYRYY